MLPVKGCDVGTDLLIDLITGLSRGAVFHYGGVPENSPLVLMGRFPSLIGRFPTLMGRRPEFFNGPFSLLKTPWKTAFLKKRGVKRFLIYRCAEGPGPKSAPRSALQVGLLARNAQKDSSRSALFRVLSRGD